MGPLGRLDVEVRLGPVTEKKSGLKGAVGLTLDGERVPGLVTTSPVYANPGQIEDLQNTTRAPTGGVTAPFEQPRGRPGGRYDTYSDVGFSSRSVVSGGLLESWPRRGARAAESDSLLMS